MQKQGDEIVFEVGDRVLVQSDWGGEQYNGPGTVSEVRNPYTKYNYRVSVDGKPWICKFSGAIGVLCETSDLQELPEC